MGFTVIRDTRERVRKGWFFTKDEQCDGTIERKLETGDYSIHGYESVVCIERKGAVTELAANLHQTRFIAELERMKAYRYKYLVLEFSLYDLMKYPEGYQKRFAKFGGRYFIKKLYEYQLEYDFHMMFTGNAVGGYYFAQGLLKAIYAKITKKQN